MKHLLDFEKPYIDLQRRLEELREQPEETDVPLDIGDEIRQLEEKIEAMKDQCNSALNAYRLSTETNTSDYKAFLARDANLS